ncbi:hypothetical protein [Paenibacillus hamazuiensis]|uniref:hypothetical protein n=1 Tax=Paenibacillus hamazuiensis TaxID=2936508 RepID=UPI002010B4CB|nr:hypothetical protein [Paenibacillus hamazuiensis]
MKQDIHFFIFLFKLETYKEYVLKLEKLIEEETISIEQGIEELIANAPETKKETLRTSLDDSEVFHLKYSYPPILRKSLFISIYSYLEVELNNLCNKIKENKNLTLSVKDIKGAGIERAAVYLSKVVHIESPFQTSLWREIKSLNDIRNFFVHDNGDRIYSTQHKQLIISLKSFSPHIRLYEPEAGEYGIEIEKEFCNLVIATVEAFLRQVISAILNKGIKLDM